MNSPSSEGFLKQVLLHTSCGTLIKSLVKCYKLGHEDGTLTTGIESENIRCDTDIP
jgi:hypothetical protein